MAAESCSWRRWITRVEWPDADLPPSLKHRLAVFLDRALALLEALTRRADGAFDVDALAALLRPVGPILAPWGMTSFSSRSNGRPAAQTPKG